MSISDSKRGDNTYRIKCVPTGLSQSYAICLMVMEKSLTGKLPADSFKDCAGCVSDKTCTALSYRKKELTAKEALFYERYQQPVIEARPMEEDTPRVDRKSESYLRGFTGVSVERPIATLKKAPRKETEMVEFSPSAILKTIQVTENKGAAI
jgi:hypothetical protein